MTYHELTSLVRTDLSAALASGPATHLADTISTLPVLEPRTRRLYRAKLTELEAILEREHPTAKALDLVRDCLCELHALASMP